MTGRQFMNAILLSLLCWLLIAYVVMGDSRQRCTASDEICAWELR